MRGNSSVHKRMAVKELMMKDFDRGEPSSGRLLNYMAQEETNPSWMLSSPHVCVATISSFLFGYHIGVVNEPLESISKDLGFAGNTLEEGLIVSICLGGAFLSCSFSGWIADAVGRRRAFQLSALPMIIGASISARTNDADVKRWRVCFWVSTIPAALLAFFIEFCAESSPWLYKRGRIAAAEIQLERLLGGFHVKSVLAELSRSDKGDDVESIRFSDLLHGHNFKGK